MTKVPEDAVNERQKKLDQLAAFIAFEREHNSHPGKTHIAEWALGEIERLRTTLVDLDSAFSFQPSCQADVVARCCCLACVKARMHEL